jgi:glucokinase
MQLLGLDVLPNRVLAVITDGSGEVLRHAAADGPPGEAIAAVLARLGRHQHDAAGLASDVDGTVIIDGVPVTVHRCAPGVAAVSGEAWVGAARGARNAVCLWIGERVFAGTLLNGEPWVGAHGLAGAAAWLALNPVERQDYRKYGGFAAEVSDRGLARRLAWRIQAGDESAVLERAGDLDAITAAHVYDGARAGDGVAISVVRDTGRYVGMAIANLVAAIDPEVIVLGGALATTGDLLFDQVKEECLRRLPPDLAAHLRIELSPLGEQGVAIGAASLALAARYR